MVRYFYIYNYVYILWNEKLYFLFLNEMLRIGFVFFCKKWDIFLNVYVKGVNEKRMVFFYVNVYVDGIDVLCNY